MKPFLFRFLFEFTAQQPVSFQNKKAKTKKHTAK